MLISHKYKFIFLKAKKVSGTSTEAFLERYCLSDEDEKKHIPQHSTDELVSEWGIVGSRLKDIGKWYNHKNPIDIKRDIGYEIWNSYSKICNVRNPYDIAVSYYYFHHKDLPVTFNPSVLDFERFLQSDHAMTYLLANKKFWMENGKFSHEFYIKQENLQQDLINLVEKLNLTLYNIDIPEYKKNETRPNYSVLYNNVSKKIIEDNFSDVLNYFNYNF